MDGVVTNKGCSNNMGEQCFLCMGRLELILVTEVVFRPTKFKIFNLVNVLVVQDWCIGKFIVFYVDGLPLYL